MEFKKYQIKNEIEMRPITEKEIEHFEKHGHIDIFETEDSESESPCVFIPKEARLTGSPKLGDMIMKVDKLSNCELVSSEDFFNMNFVDLSSDNKEDCDCCEKEIKTPETFRDRLETERSSLQEKVTKLQDFLGTEKCDGINWRQKNLLLIQENAMKTYLQCLEARTVELLNK